VPRPDRLIIGTNRGITHRTASRAFGGAAGGTLALALLVCGCVFAALAGPAVSLRLRTEALYQTLNRAGPLGTAVDVSASWNTFSSTFNIGTPGFTVSSFEAATSEIAGGLAASLPIALSYWGGLTTGLQTVSSGSALLRSATPPMLEVIYRDPLTSNVQTAAGRVVGAAVPAGVLGVTVTEQTAARFGLHPGSRLRVSGPGSSLVALLVTAVVRERDPAGTFWTADPLAEKPTLTELPDGMSSWEGAVFADPGQLTALQNAFCPALGGTACDQMQLQWEMPIAVSDITADQVQALAHGIGGVEIGLYSVMGLIASELTVSVPIAGTVAMFIATQAAVLAVLLLLFVSLIAIVIVVILLAARMVVVGRDDELTMRRARGASSRQIALLMLGGVCLAVVPAAVTGAILASAVVPGTDITTGWKLAAVVLAVALAGPPLIAVWRHRNPAPAVNPALILTAETRLSRFSLRDRRGLVVGVAACAIAAAGLVVLRDQGVSSDGGTNWFLAAAPILVAVPVALIVFRLYPLAIGALLNAWRYRAGATAYVALAGAAERRTVAALPAFTLVLALTLAAFSGTVSGAIVGGQIAYSWQSTGADAVITTNGAVSPATPRLVNSIMAITGVRHAAAVWTTTWATPTGQQLTVAAVDPAEYAALTADTPFPRVPVAAFGPADSAPASTATVIPVLASPSAAAALGTGAVRLTSSDFAGPVRVRVAGLLARTPAQPGGGAFLLMPLRTLPGARGRPAPNLVLITGADIDRAKLSALVAKALPAASLTFRADIVSAQSSAPLQHAATVLMTLTVAAAAGLALINLIFGLALSAEDRELTLARLTVMGYQSGVRLMLLMTLPAVLAALIAAAGCALALPTLISPALDLSVFTGPGVSVSFRPDLAALGVPYGTILLLVAATLMAQARRSRRHDVAALLRVG
jgi:putative ABC transport system permease protein